MPQTDALIFDVDGVLVDANDTYLQVIQEALKTFLNLPETTPGKRCFSPLQYRTAKGHPSFNDDYDLAWFGLCALLEVRQSPRAAEEEDQGMPPEIWGKLLRECPSENALAWIEARFPGAPSRKEIRTLCEEIYFGETYYENTGKKPLHPSGKGLWKKDTPLVEWHWSDLPLTSGIYTGRPETELRLALEILGWEDFPLSRRITPDSGISKPSPKGLEILAERMESRNPAFFGDSQSDLQAFQAYGKGSFFAIGSLIRHGPRYSSLDAALESLGIFPKTLQKQTL